MSSLLLTGHNRLRADDGVIELCRDALRSARAGDCAKALSVIAPLWSGVGTEPDVGGLKPEAAAELYHCAGTLTSAADQSAAAQRHARRMLRRAARASRSLGDGEKSTRSGHEVAASCLRSGRPRHARRVARTCLKYATRLEPETEAGLLLISAIADWSLGRFEESLATLENSSRLFEGISDDRIRGAFHNTLALDLKTLGLARNDCDYLQRAFVEFTAAGFYFEQAGSVTHCSSVENNLGFLVSLLGRHVDAYPHLDCAKSLALSVGDEVQAARVDVTRARVLGAEGRLAEAVQVLDAAIGALVLLGATALLPEADADREHLKERILALKPHASNVLPFSAPPARLPPRYLVTVSDDSLIHAGIEAGDALWLCNASQAQDGDLVYAITPDCVTIAFYYVEGEEVSLIYANGHCPPRHYPRNRVRVRGIALNR